MWLAVASALVAGLAVVAVATTEPTEAPVAPQVEAATPHDLRNLTFPMRWRGYSPSHVDAALARAAAALEQARGATPSAPSSTPEVPSFLAHLTGDDVDPPEGDDQSTR